MSLNYACVMIWLVSFKERKHNLFYVHFGVGRETGLLGKPTHVPFHLSQHGVRKPCYSSFQRDVSFLVEECVGKTR